MSLLSLEPLVGFTLGSARVTLVPAAEGSVPCIQVVDPVPLNFVLDSPLEIARILEAVRHTGAVPDTVTFYDADGNPVSAVRLRMPVGRVVINFANPGSAAAALILLLTGHDPSEIEWGAVTNSEMLADPVEPKDLEDFITGLIRPD